MPRTRLRHLFLNDSNFLMAALLVTHISVPYSSTPKTTARYTILLVFMDRLLSWKTGRHSVSKALDALAILFSTPFRVSLCVSFIESRYLNSDITSIGAPLITIDCIPSSLHLPATVSLILGRLTVSPHFATTSFRT